MDPNYSAVKVSNGQQRAVKVSNGQQRNFKIN